MYKVPLTPPDPAEQFLVTRTVLCFGEVTPALAQTVSQQLLLLAQRSRTPIKLVVNAQGGPLTAGEALHDVIAGIGAPVKAIGAGAVAGAALLAFVAPPRAQRFCLPHARFSLYQDLRSSPFAGQDVLAAADELARHRHRLRDLLARAAGQPAEALDPHLERPTWLEAEAAVEFGLVGRVIEAISDV